MSGTHWKVVWTLSLLACAVLPAAARSGAASCDPLDADSYALTTRASRSTGW